MSNSEWRSDRSNCWIHPTSTLKKFFRLHLYLCRKGKWMGGRINVKVAPLPEPSLMTYAGIIFHALQTVVNLLRRINRATIHRSEQVRGDLTIWSVHLFTPSALLHTGQPPVEVFISNNHLFYPYYFANQECLIPEEVRESDFAVRSSDLICELNKVSREITFFHIFFDPLLQVRVPSGISVDFMQT